MSPCLRKVVFDRLLIATVLVAALAAVLPLVAAGGPGKAPKLGEKAPPFSLLDLDGQRVTLDGELTRGPVVLVLLRGWPGYQCPFCTRQFADFLGHASAFKAAGARVVWVYPGPSDSVQQHAREFLATRALPSAFRITTDPRLRLHERLWTALGYPGGNSVSRHIRHRSWRDRPFRPDQHRARRQGACDRCSKGSGETAAVNTVARE